MDEAIKNLNDKRICDRSADKHTIIIQKGNCVTIITGNPDGTLNITHEYAAIGA